VSAIDAPVENKPVTVGSSEPASNAGRTKERHFSWSSWKEGNYKT